MEVIAEVAADKIMPGMLSGKKIRRDCFLASDRKGHEYCAKVHV